MYLPKNFENTDTKAIAEFIHKNSFAILTSIVDGKPWGTHLPLELTIDETGKFIIVTNVNSQDVTVFRRNLETGMLKKVGKPVKIKNVTCVKIKMY